MSAAVSSLSPREREQLIEAAIAARQNAYSRYSNFQVGAALLSQDGSMISGANVENASYGLTVCAERVALFSAVTSGRRAFRAVAVATAGGHAPCGACRQALAEFCDELIVLQVDADRPSMVTETTLDALLPSRFRLSGGSSD